MDPHYLGLGIKTSSRWQLGAANTRNNVPTVLPGTIRAVSIHFVGSSITTLVAFPSSISAISALSVIRNGGNAV